MVSAEAIISTVGLSHEEWLDHRRTGIGGSDAAAIVGLNPYRSRLEVYADKLGLIPEKEDSEAMRVGRDLEDYVSRRFMEATGKRVVRSNTMWRSKEHPFMLADLDRRIVGENAGLECKTTSAWNKTDFEGKEIPLTYYCQCMHYMATCGFDRMYLAVLVLGKGFYWFTIERDEAEIASLIEAERDFWTNHIEKQIPPEADGSESSAVAVSALNGRKNEPQETKLLYEVEESLRNYTMLSAQIKELEKQADACKQTVMLYMGNSEYGETNGYKVTYKATAPRCDTSMIKSKYPQIYAECMKASGSRSIRITQIKNKEIRNGI